MTIPTYLSNNREHIADLIPGDQAIPYTKKMWDKYFSEDIEFQALVEKYPKQISRQNIFDIKKGLGSNPTSSELKQFYVAVMIWGFGTTGYGAYRTNKMIKDDRFQETIEDCFDKVQVGKIRQAYDGFCLNQCGSAFFTKFIYFSAHNTTNKTMPLILDAVVARSLEEKCHCDIKKYARVNRNKGKIASVGRASDRYISYLQIMESWAEQLSVSGDQIELFLFS